MLQAETNTIPQTVMSPIKKIPPLCCQNMILEQEGSKNVNVWLKQYFTLNVLQYSGKMTSYTLFSTVLTDTAGKKLGLRHSVYRFQK